MASTYSTSLKLTLIGDGDQTGTWGQTTNANFGTLLEQAIVGQTTITMANADYTLTNLNGALDEARGAVLIITGNQNATFSVIVPAVPKLYIVTNNLNGSAIAYIKPSGGNTFQVPYSRTMYLYTNGTTFYALDYVTNAQNLVTGGTITTGAINCTSLTSSGGIIGTTGAFSGAITGTTIGGTTITAGTQFTGPGTGITSLPLTTGVTGTLPVANGGTGVTSSTGSGNNVLSTSPTLVTPLLGTPTSGNLANCTGYPSGSISGNINLATQVTGTLAVVNGGTGVTTSTGSGNNVLSTSPALVTPLLGTPTSGVLTNCTSLPLTTGVTGTLPVTNGGTGVVTSTGTGSVVLSTSPALVTPALGTPSSGNLANCTFPTLNQNTTGNAATATLATLATNATNATNATTAATVSTTVASGAVGTTQTAGTNNTQIATTAFVAAAVAVLYPIGSIYTSTVGTNPNTLFGFGTWVQFAAGKFLMGNGNASYPIATSSGSANAIVVSHTHNGSTSSASNDHIHGYSGTTTTENQGHIHQGATTGGSGVVGPNGGPAPDLEEGAGQPNVSYENMGTPNAQHTHTYSGNTGGVNVSHTHTYTTDLAGTSGTDANLPPYIVVYMWNRTA